MAAFAVAILSGPAAYADVTCIPGTCTINGSGGAIAPAASFTVTPSNVGPGYFGPISASIGNTITTLGAFTDTFNFELPRNGIGGGSVTTIAAAIGDATDINFTSVFINGAPGQIMTQLGGQIEIAFANSVNLFAGDNTITLSGVTVGANPNASYGGVISFAPTIPELGTWAMMILGFVGMGAMLRNRRGSVQVSYGANRAFA